MHERRIDSPALLPLNARREESGVGTRPCMHLHNLPLSDPLLAGAFHFQQWPRPRYNSQRRLLSKGASGAPVGFHQSNGSPPALLIRRFNRSATKSTLRLCCPAKMSPRFRPWSPGCNDTTQPGFFFMPPTARALGNPAIDSRTPLRLNVLAKTGVGTRPRISALTDLPPIGSSGGGLSFMNASPGRAS